MIEFDYIYQLVQKSRGLIRRELRKSGGSREKWYGVEPTEDIIEDIIQDSLMEAWRRWGENIRESPSTWVGWIVRGRVLNWKKYNSRRPQVNIEDYSEFSNSDQPDTEAEKMDALGHLSESEQSILDLRIGGLSNEEIATILGESVSSVKKQFSKIKSKLSNEYEGSKRDRAQSRCI